MNEQDRVLARTIEHLMARGERGARRRRALAADRTLQVLVADLAAARAAAGMTQQDVADRMSSAKGVASRLESGVRTHLPVAVGTAAARTTRARPDQTLSDGSHHGQDS